MYHYRNEAYKSPTTDASALKQQMITKWKQMKKKQQQINKLILKTRFQFYHNKSVNIYF